MCLGSSRQRPFKRPEFGIYELPGASWYRNLRFGSNWWYWKTLKLFILFVSWSFHSFSYIFPITAKYLLKMWSQAADRLSVPHCNRVLKKDRLPENWSSVNFKMRQDNLLFCMPVWSQNSQFLIVCMHNAHWTYEVNCCRSWETEVKCRNISWMGTSTGKQNLVGQYKYGCVQARPSEANLEGRLGLAQLVPASIYWC